MIETQDAALSAAGHDFRLRIYPAVDPNGSMLVWLHGGAFVFGDLDMPEADETARQLAERGTTVVSLDYTLASTDVLPMLPPLPAVEGMPSPEAFRASLDAAGPRAPYPVASLQTVAAFDWAWAHAADFGASTRAIGIGGASAGGNLAAGAALRLRDRDTALPSGQVLVYPVLHHVLPAPDEVLQAQLADLPGGLRFTTPQTQAINANYLGGASPDQYAFPAGADLRGSVPALIVTSEIDDLRPSGEGYAAELAAAGVDVEIARERGALHGFLSMPGHPSATRAVDRIARFLREQAN